MKKPKCGFDPLSRGQCGANPGSNRVAGVIDDSRPAVGTDHCILEGVGYLNRYQHQLSPCAAAVRASAPGQAHTATPAHKPARLSEQPEFPLDSSGRSEYRFRPTSLKQQYQRVHTTANTPKVGSGGQVLDEKQIHASSSSLISSLNLISLSFESVLTRIPASQTKGCQGRVCTPEITISRVLP